MAVGAPASPAPTGLLQWPLVKLQAAAATAWPGITLQVVDEIDSTNTELLRRARAGDEAATALVAERQTAGRGRIGRQWHSEAGASLTFSVSVPLQPPSWAGLSLAVGLSLAESLHPTIGLKWPNDLWWRDRKLGGILIETLGTGAPRRAIVGVGLNVSAPPQSVPELRTPATSLHEALGPVLAPDVLLQVLPPLLRALAAFEQQGFAPLRERFHTRDVLRGRAVQLSDGAQGSALRVDDEGVLWVQTAAGVHPIASGEVSVRPRAG
jgi:BirA family biotin operon repressor/biotin-[acetyl-CoA-carboxylase] ligase